MEEHFINSKIKDSGLSLLLLPTCKSLDPLGNKHALAEYHKSYPSVSLLIHSQNCNKMCSLIQKTWFIV